MKVLIFYNSKILAPVGGPTGYLYNLKKKIDFNGDEDIVFFDKIRCKPSIYYLIKKSLYLLKEKILHRVKEISQIERIYFESSIFGRLDLNQYDAVHFHSSFDLYSQKKNLENYKGKVLLTSHCPKVAHKEYIEDTITGDIYIKHKAYFDKLEEFDTYAFQRADYIFFPCKYAEEPYYNTWTKYINIRDSKKVRYLLTGTNHENIGKNKSTIRKELGIPDDAFVICFVGRHLPVKGYDVLINIFSKVDDVYVVCCGKIINENYPKSERWIEVGWTNDPFSYVNASDLFILPNKETYFDLVLLQTLSIGKTCLISNTGGNKYFKGLEDYGIYVYDDEQDALQKIDMIRTECLEKRLLREKHQLDLFEEKFTVDVFYKDYKNILKEILNG